MEESGPNRNECSLPIDILLQVCRVPVDSRGVTTEWSDALRLAAGRIAKARAAPSGLEKALTLLASVLVQLPQYAPLAPPPRYRGDARKPDRWLPRDELVRVGKQLAGLIWKDIEPAAVSAEVTRAFDRAIEFGFLDSRAGPRPEVKPTIYGMSKAGSYSSAASPERDPVTGGSAATSTAIPGSSPQLVVDENRFSVAYAGKECRFSKRQAQLFDLLTRLASSENRAISFDTLREAGNVWGEVNVGDSSIRSAITRLKMHLRKKGLERVAQAIETHKFQNRVRVQLDMAKLQSAI